MPIHPDFTTPDGQRVEIFGSGGGSAEAQRQSLPFLGEIPIYTEIRKGGDEGLPVVVSHPKEPYGQAFIQVAKNVRQRME